MRVVLLLDRISQSMQTWQSLFADRNIVVSSDSVTCKILTRNCIFPCLSYQKRVNTTVVVATASMRTEDVSPGGCCRFVCRYL